MTIANAFPDIGELLNRSKANSLVFLTGAGISKASGMPTYRGEDGLWVKDSKNFKPKTNATYKYFMEDPERSWKYTLYRQQFHREIKPNDGHLAITEIQKAISERFHLITQNVDRLHDKAGTSLNKTYEIHGNIANVRCSLPCTDDIYPMPEFHRERTAEESILPDEWESLHCPNCGRITRPHVLWFDESYNEIHFRYNSAIQKVKNAGMLITVGTTIETNLPKQLVKTAINNDIPIVAINLDNNGFTQKIEQEKLGKVVLGKSEEVLPELADFIQQL